MQCVVITLFIITLSYDKKKFSTNLVFVKFYSLSLKNILSIEVQNKVQNSGSETC